MGKYCCYRKKSVFFFFFFLMKCSLWSQSWLPVTRFCETSCHYHEAKLAVPPSQRASCFRDAPFLRSCHCSSTGVADGSEASVRSDAWGKPSSEVRAVGPRAEVPGVMEASTLPGFPWRTSAWPHRLLSYQKPQRSARPDGTGQESELAGQRARGG